MARQSSLFYAAFARQADLIRDDLLDEVDPLLNDPVLIQIAKSALASRRPKSAATGRRGEIAPDQLIRACALKHIKGWSFRELEREIRTNLVYRRFTRFDGGAIPTYKTFCCSFAILGDLSTRRIHERVVQRAVLENVARGAKLRTDTTVVESNVHYPTDSTILGDGIRVLTRTLGRIAQECEVGTLKVVDRALATKRRVLEIHRAAKAVHRQGRERLVEGYRKLLSIARAVTRQAETVGADLQRGALKLASTASTARLMKLEAELAHFTPLARQAIAQTKARVFGGDNHFAGKILSLFEVHTQAIRKGKAHKPTEFGRLVRLDEVEGGIVSGYEVQQGNPSDAHALKPALDEHQRAFQRPPRMVTADRGYFSAANVREAEERGVKRVAVPGRGRLSSAQAQKQSERWFKRALRWRTGIEARIATLKHRFGMLRAQYKGDRGFQRFVGWSVIAQNLISIARAKARRKAKADAVRAKSAA